MRKKLLLGGLACVATLLAVTAGAAEFARTCTYTEGQFSDVSSGEWYNSYVKDAYELGFMRGSSDTSFNPNGNMTVAEAVTIVSRVHDTYSSKGTVFDQTSGDNWYDCYIRYAIENDIITEGQFDDFERNISRAEMALVFSKAVPADYLTAKNNVTEIPDVPSTNAYHDELLMLYNAGVIMGNDEFGTFKPNNNIVRAEAAAIIGRIALPETRIVKTLTDANYGDAYYLINDGDCRFATGDSLGTAITSTWNIDNRNFKIASSGLGLHDQSTTDYVAVWRDIEDVSEGLLGVEMIVTTKYSTNGTSYKVTDDNKNPLFALETKDGKYYFNGNDTGVEVIDGTIYVKVKADLDDHIATLYMNGEKIGDYELSNVTASRVYIESSKEAISVVKPIRFDVYKDYLVNDLFLDPENAPLLQWEVTGGEGKVVKMGGQNMNDFNSAVIEKGTVAQNNFKKISGSVVFEAYMLLPEDTDTGFISLNSGDASVAKLIVNNDGVLKADGTKLRFHNNNIWQTLRIEADTVNGNVTYKVNGKKVGTFTLDNVADTVDNITIGCDSGKIYFDDVKVYLTHEYDDYCPKPVPITDDGYDVLINMCSLWREGSHRGWGCVSSYPDIEPALGFYDEGIAEAADWEIKFMVENGIDVQHLCWYTPSNNIVEPIKRSDYNSALHDGYFNAKYSDMMKFAFMWENSGVNCTSLDQFKEFIWSYWIDYYFLDDRYYTIDNKVVFTVWSYVNFKKAFGDTFEGAMEAVNFMNEDIKKYGFDGVMIFFSDAHKMDAGAFETFAKLGGSGAYAYHWNQDGRSANLTINRLNNNQNLGKIHVVPTVSVGFNNIGWNDAGTRRPLISLDDHKKVLEHIKNEYLPKCEGWKSKTIIVSTWNEYGEGTYVMPVQGLHGFGYIENVAEVISGDKKHENNIYPTKQQKERLGHLYPDSKTSLERHDVTIPDNDMYNSLYFINGEAFSDGIRIDKSVVQDGLYCATVTKSDPIVSIKPEYKFEPISTDKISAIRIVLKVEKEEKTEIFFMTSESPEASEDKCFKFKTTAVDEYVEYIIPVDTVPTFKGTLESFRFDIIRGAGFFVIKEFELLSIEESKVPISLYVNGNIYEQTFAPTSDNGEVYIAAEPSKGFYTNQNLYYEWSRIDGRLYISYSNDKYIIFNVGSDIAIVNGEERKLAKKVDTIDGLPVIPMFTLYDALGIRYEYDKAAKRIDAFIFYEDDDADTTINIFKNRVPYEYEFNVTGDHEKFITNGCRTTVADGFVKGVATSSDPVLNASEVNIDAKKYNKIVIGMKHRLPEELEDSRLQIYFTTDKDTAANEAKSYKTKVLGNKNDEVVEYVFDCTQNELWTGTIKSLRIDPLSGKGEFDIDYIRVVFDEEIERAQMKDYYDWLAQGFSIRNSDAEDTEDKEAFYTTANNSVVSIVKDEDTESNVWETKALAPYSYIRQKVIFVPGQTYEITMDVKLIGTSSGITEGVKTTIFCNARYDGKKDHPVVVKDLNIADGWKTVKFTVAIPENIIATPEDEVCFYTNPFNKEGVGYRIDNIKFKIVE